MVFLKISDILVKVGSGIHTVLLDRQIVRDGRKFDTPLLWMLVLMTVFSLLMIYSASVDSAVREGGSQFGYVGKQAAYVAGSAFLCGCFSLLKMKTWRWLVPWIFASSVMLLVAVLLVGNEVNGAKRWIPLVIVNFQPTELFKLAVILYLASLFTRREEVLRSMEHLGWRSIWRGTANLAMSFTNPQARRETKEMYNRFRSIILPIMLVAFGLTLVMFQPDFGSFVVITVITVGLLFLAGLPWKYFFILVGSVLSGMALMIAAAPYRMQRVLTFLDPWQDKQNTGYQLTQSLMAIGRGDWFGMGLGASLSKRGFLPEAHTDFIFAIIAEEFGFFGMCVLVFCYGWLVIRAFSIGKQARDLGLTFNAYIASGIGIWIGIQSFFNIGVNIGALPTKGLTLPLISYGGSAVAVMFVSIMLLLRIDYENRRKMRGYQEE
ncbi:FtsW/RodA/SpoVE family cell cycle protein [Neisseria bergeri]|uniref:FtsW/RodA/SpoVE family cell cycle protein n=1 Tax=Neisseria bergeri TaxID=1906581 RepID=UPI00272DBB86|nr:putative peptidoglycan glycosyltransferase FtsW [Neisseria bergeri]